MPGPRSLASAMALALLGACSDDPSITPASAVDFGGVAWVAPDASGALVVAWKPVAGAVDYRVYLSKISGRALKTAPAGKSADASLLVTAAEAGARYYVVVRSVDAQGVEDGNVVEKSAVASPDQTPPSFAGPKSVVPFGNAGAKLTWDAAVDDASPPEAIAYDVYAGPTRASLARVGIAAPGQTSIEVVGLGEPAQPFVFAVRARDAANNASAEAGVTATALGGDATPPTFGGCETVTGNGAHSAILGWEPASDNHSSIAALSYEVFTATVPGTEDVNAPPAAKVTAGRSVAVGSLLPGTRYYFICRARDAAGNLDGNTKELSITTPSDTVPPTFAGITTHVLDGEARTIALSWNPATDDQTPAAAIVYDVYESGLAGTYDFVAPARASSAPGATSITVTDLASRSALNWVVRARDLALNHDGNLVEVSGVTLTSYARDVLPVLARNCAVVGCHVTGPQGGGLNLAPAFAYEQLVNRNAIQAPIPRVSTGVDPLNNSYLYEKIAKIPRAGAVMPAPQTGNTLNPDDKSVITSWILEGAKRN